MPIPDFQSFLLPVLQATADGNPSSLHDLRQRVSEHFKLQEADLAEKLPSGSQTVFANRVAWSTVYLRKAGALESSKRGVVQITERGREILARKLPRLTAKDLRAYPEFLSFHRGSADEADVAGSSEDLTVGKSQTPQEQLEEAYGILREALANDILETVKKVPPAFFEELVVDLLVAMGYGGTVVDAGQAVGRSGDGGIDGVIKEDKLGLDFVYIQAKRWANSVGRPVVQAFAGSLEGFRARKGVLITTSYFSQDALDYVQRIEKRIVLIDGRQLAQLMIDHNVGVTSAKTYEVKRLDSDYFEGV